MPQSRETKTNQKSRVQLPPVIIIGTIAVLFPIFIFFVFQNIKRQKEHTRYLLLEKSAALIRSFEAGTRAGMRGRVWGKVRLQQLLEETAQQEDIVYLFVTDDQGRIIVHNDSEMIGKRYSDSIDYREASETVSLQWRIVTDEKERRIFEVYRKFTPVGGPGHPHIRDMIRRFRGESFRPPIPGEDVSQVIFVGLDMEVLVRAEQATVFNSILTGSLLFLAGLGGVVLLFLFQNYRTTRTSLVRIKAFSDNLVKNMPIGLLALDREQRVTSVNDVAEVILDQSAQHITGKQISEVLSKELLEKVEWVSKKGRVFEEELEISTSQGKEIPLQISISQINDENRNSTGYAVLFKDLTEVFYLRKEIARSQRLASIGRLAAGVAHEIRNPLSSIKGFATYFKERYKDVPKDHETANVMINEVDRLDRVVGQLLELSRPVQILTRPTDICSFLKDSTRLIEQKAAEKQIAVNLDIPEEPCTIHIDRDKISQVLLNLYLNAIDAMEIGGALELGLICNPTARTASIIVADTGSGIDEDDLTKIFDPYYTTKSSGTGLGLAIVHNIMDAHKGTIKAEKRHNQGMVFTVTIPDLPNEEGK